MADLDYLIPRLRLKLGDLTPASYKYLDAWLSLALLASVEALQRWWGYRYLVDETDHVYRNPSVGFSFGEPPTIERGDIQAIVLMACIIIKSGSLENFSWNMGSWRDAEISFSNISGGGSKESSLSKDWDELKQLLTSPNKKLVGSRKGHLPGYSGNQIEMGQGDEYNTFVDNKE
jgi:hypothetical protein